MASPADRLKGLGGGRLLVLAVVAVGFLLVGGRLLVNLWVELLWQAEVGYQALWWRRALWSVGTRIAAGTLVALALFLNLRHVARTLGGIQIKRRFGNLEISEQLPAAYVFWGIVALSVVLGLWFGASVTADTGLRLLVATASAPWGLEDPFLGHDASFYVFILPLLRAALVFALITAFLVFTVVAAGYAATGMLRLAKGGVVMGNQARVHLGALVAVFVLLLALHFWLGRYTLLQFGNSGVQDIFGYADAHARLPGLRGLAVITAAAAAGIFWGAWTNRLVPVVASLGGVVVGGLVLAHFYPGLVQRFQVEPNELSRETPYIEANLAFTRQGFGLSTVERERFDYDHFDADAVDWSLVRDQFAGLPVWTDNTLLSTFRQMEARYDYYDFATVDIDRYDTPDGGRTPVAISVREVDPTGIESPNWQNLHLRERYISGMGAVAALAAERTPEGRPPMVLSAIPPRFTPLTGAPGALRLTRPSVYVGARRQLHAIITPVDSAFLSPRGGRGAPGVDYPEGIALDSPLRSLALAWRFRDPNLLFASEVTDESRFVWRRSVRERAEAVAPFLSYPEAPYPVIHEGRVVWFLEGFTATRSFPLSSPREVTFRAPLNYVRNSVKVTVDAITGEITFWALPVDDPLLETFARAFPGLLRPLEEMPEGLRRHIRYSRNLLSLQSAVLLQYHQNSAAQFHRQEDAWDLPNELSRGATPVVYQPEYGLYRLPEEEEEGFYLTALFIPRGRENLTGILTGRLLADGTPELRLLDLPVEDQVPGPSQVEALVEQDPEISQQFSLWRTGGSQVWTGHLHLVPVGSHILYMEAVFLAAEEGAIPQLRGFVVSDGNQVVMAPTLPGAIRAISGQELPEGEVPEAEESFVGDAAAPAGRDPTLSTDRWPTEALDLLEQAEERLRAGDYQGFGASLDALRRLLRELAGEGGAGTPPGR